MGNKNSNTISLKSLRISNLKAVTTSTENKEDITLIWLDETINISRTKLREVNNYVLLYTEFESCLTYIRSINTEQIFLIISDAYAEQYLDEIHDLLQINSIFIYCININKYKNQFINSKNIQN